MQTPFNTMKSMNPQEFVLQKNHSTSEQGFEEWMRLKNGTIADRLGFHDKKAPENSNHRFVLPQSNSIRCWASEKFHS